MRKKILIVDDKASTLKILGDFLEEENYEVLRANNANEALAIYKNGDSIDVILADLKMPGIDGLELFRRLRDLKSEIPFVIMTAYGSIESTVEAMKEGVSNYLIKPLNYDELSIVIGRSIGDRKMSTELVDLRREVREKYAGKDIIGTHPTMQRVFEMLETVAPTDAPVLIYGETGTGKELIAKAIHASSNRHHRNMVCINSAALPDDLLDAELFGYKKGAFTGAAVSKKGRLEMADGGTLFLDEIGHMSMSLQTKLLRFLQEGSFDPVGGVITRYVDVRVIAATNKDLNEEIKAKRFLGDLLYRLDMFTITLPPLRNRGDDILLLINYFLEKYALKYNKEIKGVAPEVEAALTRYDWPGNIRELEYCIARCVILAKDTVIKIENLPGKIKVDRLASNNLQRNGIIRDIPNQGITLQELEDELIQKTIEKCEGNKSKTASMLGMSRKTLYEKINRFKMKK